MAEAPALRVVAAWSIPFVPISPNELRGKHWVAAAKHRREWGEIAAAICGRPKIGAARKRRLEVAVSRPRPLDPDNETASLKPFIDALKKLGWLRNDSRRWLDLAVEQRLGEKGLSVTLREETT